jgi:preprotein translocase subunit SecF
VTTVDEALPAQQEPEHKRPNAFVRLYRGETSFDFVGRRRLWYTISAVIILVGLVSLGTRGLNVGIAFKGGTAWEVTAPGTSVTDVENAITNAGVSNATVQILGGRTVEVQADLTNLPANEQAAKKAAVQVEMARIGHVTPGEVSVTDVGATWGSEITSRAILAVIVFLIVVMVYISARFEWKMAIAALVAVLHDLLITVGIYSIFGFQVTPDTVIAILTILGYSLYDTVVVFDRVRDNARGLGSKGNMTYSDVVNLSMNQTLARSMNTSLVAILPVLSVLVIGAQLLGATTLQNFGLALVIGLAAGAYSSIFIASPLLAQLKEREKRYASIREKLATRADRTGILTPKAAALMTASATGTAARARGRTPAPGPDRTAAVLRPGSAKSATAAKSAKKPAVVPAGDLDDEDLGPGPDGSDTSGNGAAKPAAGGGGGSATTPPGARRPPPRPRKKKGGRRR